MNPRSHNSAPVEASLRGRVQAPVMEVFASIQGEGAYVGEPQVFLRLRGCPLRCRWCDTPASWRIGDAPKARIGAGVGAGAAGGERADAWATPFQAACWIGALDATGAKSVSLTGGEPLAWPQFVLGLKPLLAGRRLHLETAGAHPLALERVLGAVDHISLDLKPPGELDAPEELAEAPPERAPRDAEEWALARKRCLELVRGRDACAKLPVSGASDPGELEELVLDLKRHAADVLLVVQPVTPMHGVPAPEPARLDEIADFALELGLAVRVLPQVHRLMGRP